MTSLQATTSEMAKNSISEIVEYRITFSHRTDKDPWERN